MMRINVITLLFLVWLRIRQGESKLCYDKVCFSDNCLQQDISTDTVSTCQMNETYGCSTHCHSFSCTSGWNCLQEGIKKGYSRTCPRNPQYGCYVDRTQSGSVTVVTAGCSSYPCSEHYTASEGARGENKCCKGDMCNDGTEVQDPSQTYCHSYTCSSGTDCLREGIRTKETGKCPMDTQYGCFVQKAQTKGLVAVSAGCSDTTCRPGKAEAFGNKVEFMCCTGNLCNDDNGGSFVNSSFVVTALFILLARSSILNE